MSRSRSACLGQLPADSGLGGGSSGGGSFGGNAVQKIIGMANSVGAGARATSTYRPGAVTLSGNRSYHAMGRAVDFVAPNLNRLHMAMQQFGPILLVGMGVTLVELLRDTSCRLAPLIQILPVAVLVLIVVGAALWWLMHRTHYGRLVHAVAAEPVREVQVVDDVDAPLEDLVGDRAAHDRPVELHLAPDRADACGAAVAACPG